MRVTVTGATGLIGTTLLARLRAEGAQVTVLSRDPERAAARLGVQATRWDPLGERAPAEALEGRDAVVHLAGEPVAQRWSRSAKRAIRESRTVGTRHLVEGLRECGSRGGEGRPQVVVSSSAIGYYGPRGEEPLDEEAPAGSGFLAEVCVAWEEQARAVEDMGVRSVQVRTGVVLDARGGALAKMLPPFRLGVGGPVAGGRQYVSWIHVEDLAGIMCTALEDERWSGPVNGTAPEPVTNRELSRALGRALHRPAVLPVPGAALRALYGEMAQIVTSGARVLPVKPLVLGYEFRHPHLDEALAAALNMD
ncbi:MAG: TIGR01777 family oxidoreductase [Solirubrobacteraceae bacterium]